MSSRRRGQTGARGLTRRRALAGLATGMVGFGAFSHLAGSGAFDAVMGGRGVNLRTTDDPNALLGIDGTDDKAVTPTFTNNADDDMDVTLDSPETVEFDVGDDGGWTAPPVSFALASGSTEAVNVRFKGECTDAGTATVDVDATFPDGSGGSLGSISLSRGVAISEAGQIDFTGSVSSAGGSGGYSFEIENTGCEDVTFTGIGINETTSNADFVSGDGSLYNRDTSEELVTPRIPVDSLDPSSDTRRDLDPTLSLAQNESVKLRFELFQRDVVVGNPNVDMRGEDVRISLYLSDGSSATIELCLDGCDF